MKALDISIEIFLICGRSFFINFPNEKAAEIAVETVTNWLKKNENKTDKIIFNVFKQEDKYCYEKILQ